VPLNVEETDLSRLEASIVAPSGKEEPCELKRLDNGQIGRISNWHCATSQHYYLSIYLFAADDVIVVRTSELMYFTGILFAPDEVGEHLVNVLKDGEHIANSPFKLPVSEGNASKVKAWGQGLEEGTANEVNEFTIDTKEAGQSRLQFVLFRLVSKQASR